MQELTIDTGVREYRVNGRGVLRFNPADPALYSRFLKCNEKLEAMQKTVAEHKAGPYGPAALAAMGRADEELRELLGEMFGDLGQLEAALGGAGLFALAENGHTVLGNLLEAVWPEIEQHAMRRMQLRAQQAVAEAEERRAAAGA